MKILGLWPTAAMSLVVGVGLAVLIPFTGGATWQGWLMVVLVLSALAVFVVFGIRADLRERRR